ncbi:hypothetical protein OC25_06800 [Pedobacter kyungheensis]|uniref:Uncharacterized protein n=1 Tax=Pedobacter kyungheensis TaxID=1069985 RepID=A0A0C1DN77_9SPHI|nr:hypothetical protein OC25_06800 [Pedobacter kyungheensis]
MPRLAAVEGLLLFGVKKNQKTSAEIFSFKGSGLAGLLQPEKFIRPNLSRTEVRCEGLVGWKCTNK